MKKTRNDKPKFKLLNRWELWILSITHWDWNFGNIFWYIHTMYSDIEKQICSEKKLHHLPNYSELFWHLNLRLWNIAYKKRDRMIFEWDDEGIKDLKMLLDKDYAIKLINDFVDFSPLKIKWKN